jgi:hypothetical protein
VSRLSAWISDTLCRLATGGGFATRQLYTDQEEVLFDAARPVILNGIEDFVARPDLADRAIFLTLRAIPEEDRRPEKELWAAFEVDLLLILGALLDVVSTGLGRIDEVELDTLPRMADFAIWATACLDPIFGEGALMRAYCGNRDEAVDNVIEVDPVASALRAMMNTEEAWSGTASDLHEKLSEQVGDKVNRTKSWPRSARAFSGRLRRAATPLRGVGIEVSFDHREGKSRTRVIQVSRRAEDGGELVSAPSAESPGFESAIDDEASEFDF